MIPVVTMNDKGDLYYQVFNDNLTPVEQINRKLLTALYMSQTEITNLRDQISRKVAAGELDSAKIGAINTAAAALLNAVKKALTDFDDAVAK